MKGVATDIVKNEGVAGEDESENQKVEFEVKAKMGVALDAKDSRV